jgi:4-amino-4-deoxy-L-arabinose transferase-like glycosyltransferase
LAGLAFVPLLGIEDDESLFAAPLLNPRAWHWAMKSGHLRLPIMVMSYIGTLKTLLYSLIFRLAPPGVWSTRVPMLVAGAASVRIFYLLLRRTAGPRAAVLGVALLATDACYLLTTVFDWGPVALQHLLLTGAMYLLVRFAQKRSHRALAGGFLLLGLAVWDKALAVWMISGMAVAATVVFWRPIAALLTRRRAAIAAFWFVLGASPLLIFNVKTHWSTFRGNVKRDTSGISGKAGMLMNTVNGEGLFGYLADED